MDAVLLYQSCLRQYPGVAKFGIALEWGSRGLEFESRHSDQKSRNSIYCFCFFLLMRDLNYKLQMSGGHLLGG